MSRKQPFEGKAMSSFNLFFQLYLKAKHETWVPGDFILGVTSNDSTFKLVEEHFELLFKLNSFSVFFLNYNKIT